MKPCRKEKISDVSYGLGKTASSPLSTLAYIVALARYVVKKKKKVT